MIRIRSWVLPAGVAAGLMLLPALGSTATTTPPNTTGTPANTPAAIPPANTPTPAPPGNTATATPPAKPPAATPAKVPAATPAKIPAAAPAKPPAAVPAKPPAAPLVKIPADNATVATLGSVRSQCIAAARVVQQKEQVFAGLELAIGVMERGAAAKQQQLDTNSKQEEHLLGALERLSRASPAALALSEGPLERSRSGILLTSALPALQVQAQMLSAQLAALAAERAQIDGRRPERDAARQAMIKARDQLAGLVSKRGELIAKLLPGDSKNPAADKLGDQASDLTDLIKRADTEADRRDKETLARLRVVAPKKGVATPPTDPTRPADIRNPDAPHMAMTWPVVGEVAAKFGENDRSGKPSDGLTINTLPSALVVAPFDGQVEFLGNFRGYGLILIIRHAGGYHSVLTGLGQADVTGGEWLLAGEPVGTVPASDDKNAGATFYLELRRDNRPVDPQTRLASRE